MRGEHKPLTCAVYTRKSSEEGLEQSFNSLDAQREACEAYIASQRHEGWGLFSKHYDDGGFSGGNMERPALVQLIDDIKAGKVTVVVVYKVDRLTRSLADFAKLVELFDRFGVSFVSVTQQFNTTTSMGRLTLNVLLSFAQFEREVTGERIRDKIAASKKKGMFMGGGYPLGYDLHDHELVVNEGEAVKVREIFALYLKLGDARRLVAEVAKRGYRTKVRTSESGRTTGGLPIIRSHLYYILKNRTYLGEIAHKGQIYQGRHKPIIERALWDQVQTLLNKNAVARASRKWAQQPSPLAGFLFDDVGNRLTPSHTCKGSARYRYYVSQALIKDRPDQLGLIKRVPAEEIESIVAGQVCDLCSNSNGILEALSDVGIDFHEQRSMVDKICALATAIREHGEAGWIGLSSKIVQKIVVAPTQVKITIDLHKLITTSSANGAPAAQNEPTLGRSLTLDLIAAVRVTRSGRQKSLVVLDADGSHQLINKSMTLALGRALKWDREIRSGQSLNAIAKREGVSTTYATRIMPFAFLAPDIVEAIYNGRQPADLKVKAVTADLPLDWASQRRVLGFPSR